jgi:Mg/Co/Ni transporter MgtE
MPLNQSQIDTLRRLVRHGNTQSAARALSKFSIPDVALLFSDLDAVGSIILTTFTDVFGFLAFLGLAALFINWLL